MNIILFFLKYWKWGGVMLLAAAFLISAHLAETRGEKLKQAQHSLKTERDYYETQIRKIEKARQNEKERNDFRKKQNRNIKLADNHSLRDVYERLRERQAGRLAK